MGIANGWNAYRSKQILYGVIMGNFTSFDISSFIGMDTSRDETGLQSGQLSLAHNIRYLATGGIQTRGGGRLLIADPTGGGASVYGLANYKNSTGTEYLITAQGTKLYYLETTWKDTTSAITASTRTRFCQAGIDSDTALYAMNGTDRVIKLAMDTGAVKGKSITVANGFSHDAPTDAFMAIQHKSRLFLLSKKGIYYSDLLDFDHLDPAMFIQVAPGFDGECQSIAVWGDSLFILKDFGIYVLPNASDDIVDWNILRTNASTGTQSPDSVVRTKIGIVFFSSDNAIRLISPDITYSSQEFTLGGSGTPIIGHAIENDIQTLLDPAYKSIITAFEHQDEYIFGFKSVSNATAYCDQWYFADVSKFMQMEGITQIQPYWGMYTGFDFDFVTKQTVGGKVKVYGAKNTTGQIHETLNTTYYDDNNTSLNPRAVLGWNHLGSPNLLKKLLRVVVIAETEAWNINIKINAYKIPGMLPEKGLGVSKVYSKQGSSGGTVGSALADTAIVGSIGMGSSVFPVNMIGHYFRLEFSNSNIDEPIVINRIELYYKPIRSNA